MKVTAVSTLLVALSLFEVTSSAEVASSSGDPLFTALTEWIVSNDGYFNPKQEFRLSDPSNPYSRKGMFATERIEKGEQLFTVPWKCILSDPNDDTSTTAMACRTFQKVIDEMEKFQNNEYTFYEPYMAILDANRLTPWPSGWTSAGRDLLIEVLGGSALPPEQPFGWFDDWVEECDGDVEDSTAVECVMSFLMRGEDNRLIPLYDLYNHRNGKWFNTDTIVEELEYQAMKASRVIEAGEEIYGSYYMCSNCGSYRKWHYGTADVLRDYGFVEQFPQRWIFRRERIGFDLDEIEQDGSLQVRWLPHYKATKKGIASLQKQLLRLTKVVLPKLQRVQKQLQDPASSDGYELPLKHEFDSIWDYFQAMTVALKHAFPSAEGTSKCAGGFERDGECVFMDGYDDLRNKELNYSPRYQKTCENSYVFQYKNYAATTVNSSYQALNWYVRPEDKDVCLELDDTLQICSCYRPHYHEFMTHLPARYKDTIKRAVFVGGGDSMLLHELLKYPSIELVLGLELDQTVVRTSFKYFRSQPHFDDERVEWWFGDATKSLLMLPKDYFGSFDLVLVDLSETVVAVPVTDSMNIIETLTQLLKPDGIFVKNEIYFPELSKMFDYTIQVYFQDVPKICDQVYAMGSNRIDFINPDMDNLKGHDVEMLLLEPVESNEDRFAYIHNYQKNDAREQGKCGESTEMIGEFDHNAGVLMVLEAENTTLSPLNWETVGPPIQLALEKVGLTPVSSVSRVSSEGTKGNGDTGVVVMREGVVTARMWPDEAYCAFDIHLWGRFTKMESVRSALAGVVGSDRASLSSYRVLVSGMNGASTWNEDKDTIGPVITLSRNCDEDVESSSALSAVSSDELAKIALEESLKLIQSENVVAVTMCGESDERCSSLKVLANSKNTRNVTTLLSCHGIEEASNSTELLFKCETDRLGALREAVRENGKISALVIDPSTPIEMLRVMTSIVTDHRDRLFTDHVIFIGFMPDKTEIQRRNFLERCLVSFNARFSYRAEVEMKTAETEFELGVVSVDDPQFIAHVKDVADVIASRAEVESDVRKVMGGRFKMQENWSPKRFPVNDYDQAPGIEHYNKQVPLGHQVVLRLEMDQTSEPETLAKDVTTALESSLTEAKFTDPQFNAFHDEVGDGIVIVTLASEGSAVVVLDGKNGFDMNLFTFDSDVADRFVEEFTSRLSKAKVLSREDQPRGIGRVINLMKDIAKVE